MEHRGAQLLQPQGDASTLNRIEWARYSHLADEQFFRVTRRQLEIEEWIASKGCERQTDALYFTRRVEYPWAFLQIPEKASAVLDAGGGPATFQYMLASYLPEAYNIDVNPTWVEKVKRVKEKTGAFKNLIVAQGNIDNIPYADKTFSATVCISVLEHSDQEKLVDMVDELLRVTSGPVLMSVDVGAGREMMTLETLKHIGRRAGIMVPSVPPDAMLGTIRGEPYRVALVRLEASS